MENHEELHERQLQMLKEAFNKLFVESLVNKYGELSEKVTTDIKNLRNDLKEIRNFFETKCISDNKKISNMCNEIEDVNKLKDEIKTLNENVGVLIKEKQDHVLDKKIKMLSILLYLNIALSVVLFFLLFTK